MHHDPNDFPSMFSIDVSAEPPGTSANEGNDGSETTVALLRQLVEGQEQQNKLLQELSEQMSQTQKQRAAELGQWKEANPELSQYCRYAAETLSRVQTQFLEKLTEEISDNEDALMDGEFMLSDFVDRFGPRLAHLNGVLQVLSQLSSQPARPNTPQS
ncbi:MAG TPA: hypothetical protein DCY79_15940 [Planctomycetaceae bacterium]|nr:hypothetical protein [Blastopirellula sp.]HAY81295.1 hypothetical protein [Planctomycetaceae bacterium]|tara:strand:+ start:407 stop:880 length:474 start_codon:yes stop_codon:yes gene_type:complete